MVVDTIRQRLAVGVSSEGDDRFTLNSLRNAARQPGVAFVMSGS
jgi:hypothetical protein